MANPIKLLRESRLPDDIDIRFADLMDRLSGEAAGPDLYLAVVLLNNIVTRQQHICLDLETWADRPLSDLFVDAAVDQVSYLAGIRTPSLNAWKENLFQSPVVGHPGQYRPLVLDESGSRLYLYRYWLHEQELAGAVTSRITLPGFCSDPDRLRQGLKRCLAGPGRAGPDWQQVAAYAALTRRFCVITGGPGTGKTYTVAAILALLRDQRSDPAVALAAPTGKAAARLQESLGSSPLTAGDPPPAVTIHRLLGRGYSGPDFRYHAGHRLPVDMVIVDEASMVPLTLMSDLLRALPDEAGVILLGDRHQLASVEAGAVLGDICRAAAVDGFSRKFREEYAEVAGETIPVAGPEPDSGNNPLDDGVVELKDNRRFPAGSAIDLVSRAVQAGDPARLWQNLAADKSGGISRRSLPARDDLAEALRPHVENYFSRLSAATGPAEAISLLNRFRVLCAHKRGPYGVDHINREVQALLAGQGLIDPSDRFYQGRPLIVARNDYRLNLYNGDVGVCWDNEEGYSRACFLNEQRSLRRMAPLLLPDHDTVYAMTIHKSQGSEFERVLVVLPEQPSPVLTRELVYTALSRAVSSVEIWAGEEVLEYAVGKRLRRSSGLRDALLPLH
ncbi:MAG: exodeoxyribonuclease V subunit alpha [Desulfosudaceae bacterium]